MSHETPVREAAERVKTECVLHRDGASIQMDDPHARFALDIELLADTILAASTPAAADECPYCGGTYGDGHGCSGVPASPPAADTGRLIEELENLLDKWRERQRRNEINSEYDYADSSVLCARLSGRAEAQKECADELQALLTRVSGQPTGDINNELAEAKIATREDIKNVYAEGIEVGKALGTALARRADGADGAARDGDGGKTS